MDIKLTMPQLNHLKSIYWLLSGERGSGKTRVLANAIILTAKSNPGRKVYFINHDIFHFGKNTNTASFELKKEVCKLIDNKKGFKIVENENCLIFGIN